MAIALWAIRNADGIRGMAGHAQAGVASHAAWLQLSVCAPYEKGAQVMRIG